MYIPYQLRSWHDIFVDIYLSLLYWYSMYVMGMGEKLEEEGPEMKKGDYWCGADDIDNSW